MFVPPPDITRYLLPKEQVQYMDRRHPVVLLGPLGIVMAVCVLAGFFVAAAGAGAILDLYMIVIVGALGWLIYRIVRWSRVLLVVTNRRVFEVESLLLSKASIKPVFRQGVVFIQDPVGERLNYGTVLTQMPNGDRVHTFRWIHNPKAFAQAVTNLAV